MSLHRRSRLNEIEKELDSVELIRTMQTEIIELKEANRCLNKALIEACKDKESKWKMSKNRIAESYINFARRVQK